MTHRLAVVLTCFALAAFGCGTEDDENGNAGGAGGTGGVGGGGAGGGGSGGGGSGGGACVPLDGEAIEAPESAWTWVPIEGNRCRDGSETGIGIYRNPGATRLVIYLEGGGACFNQITCAQNPAAFGAEQFANVNFNGILAPTDEANPVGEASFVYVPYCTGDVHGGSAESADVNRGPTAQAFVGHDNIARALERIVPTFPEAEQIVLTGVSAGGFGTWLNYEQVAEAFCREDVVLLSDSGPTHGTPHLASCLQERWLGLWDLDETLPAGCTDCDPTSGEGVNALVDHLAGSYPEGRFGLVSSTRDETISLFFAFGVDECAALDVGLPNTTLGGAAFAEGLVELYDEVFVPRENAAAFVIESNVHTWFRSRLETTSNGVVLRDWIDDFVGGDLPDSVWPEQVPEEPAAE